MTGVEAVSNGVPAFKAPEAKNAAATMAMMAGYRSPCSWGITLLAGAYGVVRRAGDRRVAGGAAACSTAVVSLTTSCKPPRWLIARPGRKYCYAGLSGASRGFWLANRYLPASRNQAISLAYSNGIVGLSI